MKALKKADLIVQVILIVVLTVVSLVKADGFFLTAYAIIGGWQATSMIIHFIKKWHPVKGGRRSNFQLVTLGLLLIIGLMPLFPILFILVYILIYIVPVLIISYTWICFMEVFHYAKRPLELI